MKKLLALILSMLLVASCFALVAVAADEDTTAAETTAEDTTAAEGEETTEAAPNYTNTLLTFDENAKSMKLLTSQNGINKTFFKTEWEGAKLKITDASDPYVYINWSVYLKKAELEKVDSQAYPFIVFKLKIEGYVDDFELFYCAGDVTGADPNYASTTDYPAAGTGEVEYIIYDLTGNCEGNYNQFRFDIMGADEDTVVYLYEMALFATEDEAIEYAGFNEEPTEEETEADTEAATTEADTEAATKAPSTTAPAEEKGCGSVVSVGALVAIITLGAVCIKKKD